MKIYLRHISSLFIIFLFSAFSIFAGDAEFLGQLDKTLVAKTEDFEKVVFKYASPERMKSAVSFGENASLAVGQLYHPQTGNFSVSALLIEESDENEINPIIYIDFDADGKLSDAEKFTFKQEKADNPYIWNVTVDLPVKDNFFTHGQVFLQYFKSIKMDGMTDDDRLITQSTEILARGNVDIKGKKFPVQYAYDFGSKKIDPKNGWLGIDTNEDGKIDMDELSFEAAKADDETIVLRAGQTYVSTKKVDISKNQIVMREHEQKDYRRLELAIGKEFPDFAFTDFNNKKRKFSEFRGKYILLDVWGFWCPPCRTELPYIRESFRRFGNRNLEVVGLNTDPVPPDQVKKIMSDNGMNWTQGQLTSVFDLLNKGLRIESFPTTFLISPDGKILSMSRHLRGELDLRGQDLLETLDEILPQKTN